MAGSPGTTRWAARRASAPNCAASGERYVLAVPSNTTIRDLDGAVPERGSRGPHPKRAFEQVRAWAHSLSPGAWRRIEVAEEGERGPVVVEIAGTRVVARTDRGRIGPEELLVVVRSRDETGEAKYDYHLSNASPETAPGVLARVIKAGHRIEECLQRGKSEAGLADYQVRTWSGWYHHQALSLIAAWFLVQETRRGEKADAGVDAAASAGRIGITAPCRVRV